jgi:hypothetical protein
VHLHARPPTQLPLVSTSAIALSPAPTQKQA